MFGKSPAGASAQVRRLLYEDSLRQRRRQEEGEEGEEGAEGVLEAAAGPRRRLQQLFSGPAAFLLPDKLVPMPQLQQMLEPLKKYQVGLRGRLHDACRRPPATQAGAIPKLGRGSACCLDA